MQIFSGFPENEKKILKIKMGLNNRILDFK